MPVIQRLLRSYFFWAYVVLLLALGVLLFLAWSLRTPVVEPSSDELYVLYQKLLHNRSFVLGDAALQKGDLATAHEQFAAAALSTNDIDEQGYLHYVSGLTDPVLSSAITELKGVVEGNGYSKIARALATTALGTRTILVGDEAVFLKVFSGLPYVTFMDQHDRSLVYRRLFDYASSFMPTAESELHIALWYATLVYERKKQGGELSERDKASLVNWKSVITVKLRNAFAFNNRMSTLPPHFSNGYDAALLLQARVLGTLKLAQEPVTIEPESIYATLINAKEPRVAVEARFFYALYLDYFFGDAKKPEIIDLIHSLYTTDTYRPVTAELMKSAKNERLGIKSGVLTLVSLDPKLRDYLFSLGWKNSDFE